jgi:hypothetical protein
MSTGVEPMTSVTPMAMAQREDVVSDGELSPTSSSLTRRPDGGRFLHGAESGRVGELVYRNADAGFAKHHILPVGSRDPQ